MMINIGTPERWVRLIAGAVLLALAFLGGLSTTWAWVSGMGNSAPSTGAERELHSVSTRMPPTKPAARL